MRRWATPLLAATLALGLVAAETTATGPVGTASTSMVGADATVSGPVSGAVQLLDIGTSATTDPDAETAGPFAAIDLVPLRRDGQAVGATSIRSDQDGQGSSSPVDQRGVAGLGAAVDPVDMTVTATEDRAAAVLGAVSGELAVLAGTLGIDLSLAGISSEVTSEAASATQALGVSPLEVSLGDLLPLEILELLPIDVLLELGDRLPIGSQLRGVVEGLLDAQLDLDKRLRDIESAGDDLDGLLDDLDALRDARALLDSAVATLRGLGVSTALIDDLLDDPAGTIDGILANPGGTVGSIGGGISDDTTLDEDVDGLLGDEGDLLGLSTSGATVSAQSTALEDALLAVVAAQEALEDLEAELGTETQVIAQINDVVDQLVTLLLGLEGILNDVFAALNDLLGSLPELLAALDAAELVSVAPLEMSVQATAGPTLEDSQATVLCQAGAVSVAGQALGSPSCTAPLTAVNDQLQTALTLVEGVLAALPVQVVSLPEVTLEVFPEVRQEVSEADDGTVTAVAQVVALRLGLPSVTIDPAGVLDGLLDTRIADLVADLQAQVPDAVDLSSLGLTDLAAELDAALATLPDLADLLGQIEALLGGLPDGLDLPTLATPGLHLEVDPTSEASYRAAAAPAPEPAPAPDTPPSLPSTGGGMVLFGLLSLAGATLLRRRR